MPQELVYTSATIGLKPGSKGFCTVAATNGIPPRTITLLESLSGYRHVHPPTQSPHPGNPIAWSHLLTPAGESLISRVADAGLDYSGRSNKIAHHVLLAQQERQAFGPAAMMRAGQNLIASWETPPRWLGTRKLDAGTEAAIPSSNWQSITGDAGWAGVLAQAAVAPEMPECFVIFESGQDLLALFDESLSLLSPEQRWKVTFSTFFARLPPGMTCQWRGILKGSAEHRAVPPHDRVVRIDLTSRTPTQASGPLIDQARSGQKTPTASRGIASVTRGQATHGATLVERVASPMRLPPATDLAELRSPSAVDDRPPILESSVVRRRSSSKLAFAIVLLCFLLATVGGATYIIWKNTTLASHDIDKPVVADSANDLPATEIVAPTTDVEFPKIEPVDSELTSSDGLNDAPEPAPPMSANVAAESITENPPAAQLTENDPSVEMPAVSVEPTDPYSNDPTESRTAELESKSIQLEYLLEPDVWRQIEKQQEKWTGDQSVYRREFDIDLPTRVAAVTIDADGKITRDGQLNYDMSSNALVFGQRSASGLVPPTKVILFERDAIVLQPNYAKRIGNRFIIAETNNDWRLLTIQGALTPDTGMDGPSDVELLVQEDNTASRVVNLGEINPSLLSLASVRLSSSADREWRVTEDTGGTQFTRSLEGLNQLDTPPFRFIVSVSLVKTDPTRIRINARIKTPVGRTNQSQRSNDTQLLDRVRNARAELSSIPLEVDIASRFQFGTQRFSVVLSQFVIGFE